MHASQWSRFAIIIGLLAVLVGGMGAAVFEETLTAAAMVSSEIQRAVAQFPAASFTPAPTHTATATVVFRSTNTALPTVTASPQPTHTATVTAEVFQHLVSGPFPAASFTPTPTMTSTSTATATSSPTRTSSPTATATPSPTNTARPTVTPTTSPTSTPRPTMTATIRPTRTPRPTRVVNYTTTAVVTANRLNVRRGPGPEYAQLTQLSNGARVTLIGRNATSTWVQISGSGERWLNVDYLRISGSVSRLPVTVFEIGDWQPARQTIGVRGRVTTTVRVRGGPGTSYRQLSNPDILEDGDVVDIVGRSSNNEWYQVNIGTRSAWIASNWVTIIAGGSVTIPITE